MEAKSLRILGVLVLLLGLGGAAWLYQGARDAPGEAAGYVTEGDATYPVRPGDYKGYDRNMEAMGGKALVLVDAVERWFAGVWQGRTPAAVTIFCTVVAAGALFQAAGRR